MSDEEMQVAGMSSDEDEAEEVVSRAATARSMSSEDGAPEDGGSDDDEVMDKGDGKSEGDDGGDGDKSDADDDDDEEEGGDDEDEVAEGELELALIEGTLFPADCTPQYREAYESLGTNKISARKACGGTVQGMLDVFNHMYDFMVMAAERTRTPWETYEFTCDLFDVNPDEVAPPELVKQRVMNTMIRMTKLHSGIQREISNDMHIVETMQNDEAPSDVGNYLTNREKCINANRAKFQRMATILQQGANLLTAHTVQFAALRPECTVRVPFPVLAWSIMEADTESKPITGPQAVQRSLLQMLFAENKRRCGMTVMTPRTIPMRNGGVLNSHSYQTDCTIKEFVEKRTALTVDHNLWKRRGPVKFLVDELTDADTYLFPRLMPSQAVISTPDFLIDMNKMQFFPLDEHNPRMARLRTAADTAVEQLNDMITLRDDDIAIIRPVRNILHSFVIQMREVMKAAEEEDGGDDDGDAILSATADVLDLSTDLQHALQEMSDREYAAARKEIMDDKTLSEEEKEEELEERPRDTWGLFSMAEAEARLAHFDVVIRCKAQCSKHMKIFRGVLEQMFPTHPPPDDLIAEIFVDNTFCWGMLDEFLVLRESTVTIGDESATMLVLDWRAFQAPHFDRVLVDQELPQDAIDFFYVMMGRQIFPHSTFERWQVVFEVMGWSNTGKSLICNIMEAFHRERGSRITRTGRLANNIEPMFGTSEVLGGEKEENRVFAVVHPDLTKQFCKNFPMGIFLSWAANEEAPHAVKFKSPILASPPHTALFSNEGIQYDSDNFDAGNRRRISVRFAVPITKPDTTLEPKIMEEDLLALMLRSAWAYWLLTKQNEGIGIWTKAEDGGFLPDYFFKMRDVNRMASQPLLAFLTNSKDDQLEFGEDKFISMKMFKTLANTFTDNNATYRRVDWSNETSVRQILDKFHCRLVVPSQAADADALPPGLRSNSRRGQWVLGVAEFVAGGVAAAARTPAHVAQAAPQVASQAGVITGADM